MHKYLEVIEIKSGTCIERVEKSDVNKKNLEIVNNPNWEVKEVSSQYKLKTK